MAKPPRFEFPTAPDPALRRVWRWRAFGFSFLNALFLGFLLGGFIVTFTSTPKTRPSTGDIFGLWLLCFLVIWFIGAIVGGIWAGMAARRYRFEVTDDEIVVRKGIVFTTTTRIPMRKIQDIHIRQGPLLRAFGLASIKIDTAGGTTPGYHFHPLQMVLSSEGQLPGLRNAEDVAKALSDRVKKIRDEL